MANPTNLNEAIYAVLKMLPTDVKEGIVSRQINPGRFHHGLGRQLRNEWGLWTGGPLHDYFEAHGIWHADDMSGIILESAARTLRNEPLDLQGQVDEYLQFWKDHPQ
jgi:hypothetical protein